MSFEAYAIAIRLKLVDEVSGGLIGLAGKFTAFNKHIGQSKEELTKLETQLKSIKLLAYGGGAMLGAGSGMLYGLKGPLEEAKAWAQESAKFTSLGFGDKVNQDAQKFALGMKTYGTSARENLTLVSDAMAVFKDLGHAEMVAPILAKMKFANEAVFGKEQGGANEGKFMDLLKVIEMRRGLSSPMEFANQANFAQMTIAGSRGRVDASQMLNALKTGGVAVAGMTNDQFYLGSEPLIQEFGGFRWGTGTAAAYQNFVQMRGSIASQQEMMRLGLLDPSKVEFNSLGGVKKALPGAFKGQYLWDQGKSNAQTVLSEVLLPAFAKAGITSEAGILQELGRIMSNTRGSSLYSRAYQQRVSLQTQWEANRHAQNIDQLAATGAASPEGKMIDLSAKWRDVLRDLGIVVLPAAIKGIEGLTGVVKGIDSLVRTFPVSSTLLVGAFTALAVSATAGGAIMLTIAGFKGLDLALKTTKLGAGLAEVSGGLGGLAGKLGGVAGILGKAGLLATAGAIGYDVGSWLNDKFKLDQKIGGFFAAQYNPNKPTSHSPYLTTGKGGTALAVHTQVNLDGRHLTDVVSHHLADDFGVNTGGMFDPTLSLPPVGLNFAR